MDISKFVQLGSIAVMCFIVGQIVKALPFIATKWIPIIVGVVGGALGLFGQSLMIPGLMELNPYDAIATGIISGIASSGMYSLYKNISGGYCDNEVPKGVADSDG